MKKIKLCLLVLPISLLMCFTLPSCKKEDKNALKPNTLSYNSGNAALINSNSTEYIIADVEGVPEQTKLNLQDAEGAAFLTSYDYCEYDDPFTRLKVRNILTQEIISFKFFSSICCTSFKQPLHVGRFSLTNTTDSSVSGSYLNPEVYTNTSGIGILGAKMSPDSGDYFEITEIKTINEVEYAFGKFNISYQYGEDFSQNMKFKDGIFKFKTEQF